MSSPTRIGTQASSPAVALACKPVEFGQVSRSAWENLYRQTPAATPFARWNVHRAWWDAYGETAHEQYLVCTEPGQAPTDDGIRAIIPLMHRHEEEPGDERTATVLRRQARGGTRVRPDAKAIFFGASYHADYATLLCAPDDVPAAANGLAGALEATPDGSHGDQPWDVVDLRRLRRDDPALEALSTALAERASGAGWQFIREQEDVCPVVSVEGADWDEYLATLGKKSRHEIRRKLRRAQEAGELRVSIERPERGAIDTFIDLHQRRFGNDGLFPETEGGERSRHFIRRLAELELETADCQLHVAQVRSDDRLIFSALAFDDGYTCYLYNAGMDPDAAELSPGISGTAMYLQDRLAAGRRRFDFMRGSEPYKYEWGAQDEVIERLLVLREAAA